MAATSLLQGIDGPLERFPSQSATDHGKHVHQTAKKVSWAPESNLCQVRLFLAEDPPLQSALDDQEHLQAKQSWLWHTEGSGSERDLPPGYGNNYRKQSIQEDAFVPQTTWCCPPRFVMDPAWKVVAGDDSLEVDEQNDREVRTLEAIYPRPSAIPPSPAEPQKPEEDYDDSDTRIIPLIPIEDDESEDLDEVPSAEELWKLGTTFQDGNCFTTGHLPLDFEGHAPLSSSDPATDLGKSAAAAAAFLTITRSNEKGCMIDQDLLIKIFSDPQMMEKLASQQSQTNNLLYPMPISEPIDTKHNGPVSPCSADQDQNLLSMSRLQCAFQIAPSAVAESSRSSLAKSEMACSNFQGPSNPCNMETKTFGTAARSLAQTAAVPVALSSALPHTGLHPLSRPVISVSTTVCLPSRGGSTAAPTVSAVHRQSPFPDEQYYRDLIQKHGVQNGSEQLKHQHGIQYYKDLIQQHGGAQNLDQVSQVHCSSSDRVGGNFVNNERSCIDPNKPKFRKPCLYFNTPNGCRRGPSCMFLHMDPERPRLDDSDLQNSKRVKAENEALEKN